MKKTYVSPEITAIQMSDSVLTLTESNNVDLPEDDLNE